MPWVTEEEIQAAKNMTAYEYLRTHQAQRLQKTRPRNEWQLTDHVNCHSFLVLVFCSLCA